MEDASLSTKTISCPSFSGLLNTRFRPSFCYFLRKPPTFGGCHSKNTYKLHNTTRIKQFALHFKGQRGKGHSFFSCPPSMLSPCMSSSNLSFSLSDRTVTISEGRKSMIYETRLYSLLLTNNPNFLAQQQISVAENVITCNS
jgi:hypothetical protein